MKRMLTLLLTLAVCGVAAQERFDDVLRRNPWNAGVNAAGIRQDTVSRSFAAVCFTKENGGLADRSASDDSWNAGAVTQSIRHFEKISFAGSFSYDYFEGRNMDGSMFTLPGYYPVDILEFTPGRKNRETYAFTGRVAARLGERWTGGLDVAFEARNYAKRKDLRHKNTRLDFECAPGIMYRAGRFAAGAAYIAGINTEKVEAEEIGSSEDDLMAFFDRGLRYGALRLWQSNDLHLTTSGVSGFPVRETVQGAAVQVQYGPLFAEADYRFRRGRTGERGIIWHEFETHRTTGRAVLSLPRVGWSHFVRLSFDWQSLGNRENILTYENINGVSNPRIHGSVPVFGRKQLLLEGEYELSDEGTDIRLGGSYSRLNRQSTLMYPCVKEQLLHYLQAYADVIRRFGPWELNLRAEFRKGGFSEREERFETVQQPGNYPERLDAFYHWENEYLTASRLGLGLGVRRNIRRFYIDLAARWEHGFDLQYVAQPNRVRATLSFGYNF